MTNKAMAYQEKKPFTHAPLFCVIKWQIQQPIQDKADYDHAKKTVAQVFQANFRAVLADAIRSAK